MRATVKFLWPTGSRLSPVFLEMPVDVLENRVLMGRREYRVRPTGGSGEVWVSESRLSFTEGDGNA